MGLMDFFSHDAGQARRKWLDDKANGLVEFVPPELRPWLALGNELNPVTSMERAGQGAQRVADPNVRGWDKVAAVGDTASNMAAVLAPVAAANKAGVPATNAIVEALTAASPMKGAVGDFAASEAGNLPIGRVAADPIATRGAEIMDMLRAGRGSDVTDAMMDMGDAADNAALSDWLNANYDLPMDAASRATRADAMGFEIRKPLYHGTTDAAAESIRGAGFNSRVFGAPSRTVASDYAENVAGWNDAPEIVQFVARPTSGGIDYDMPGSSLVPFGNGQPTFAEAWRQNLSMGFDPSGVRAADARFDPRLAHLRNLLAGVGGLGLMLPQSGNEPQ